MTPKQSVELAANHILAARRAIAHLPQADDERLEDACVALAHAEYLCAEWIAAWQADNEPAPM